MKRWNDIFNPIVRITINFSKYISLQIILLAVLSVIFLSINNEVLAFGVATPYLTNDTVNLEPGQSYSYIIKIQNNEDVSFYVDLAYSSDDNIATLNSTEFHISPKSYDNEFIFIINMPNTSMPGSIYALSYTARPIINTTGQVPMNVEIKRTVYFVSVSEGGEGYYLTTPSFTDNLLRNLLVTLYAIKVYFIIALILIVILFVLVILWRTAKSISERNTMSAPYTIEDAKTIDELVTLINLMPEELFNNKAIRQEYSLKFLSFGEKFLSEKVLVVNSKRQMLKVLK